MTKKTDSLKSALENWDIFAGYKREFIRRYQDPDGGEPLCGHPTWDAFMTDLSYDMAAAGEILAAAVKEYLDK